MRSVHAVVPAGIDDSTRPSGGNRYDRRVLDGLAALGWRVRTEEVAGGWPEPDAGALADLRHAVAAIPDGAVVLIDGLIASAAPEVLVAESRRVRSAVLVHMPLGTRPGTARDRERSVLTVARAVVATSEWARDQLLRWYALNPRGVHVARPGVDPALAARHSPGGGRLLCVAAVAPHKGHDVLLRALLASTDLGWSCRIVGPLDRDPDFVAGLRATAAAPSVADRVEFAGPLTGADLDSAYAAADLLVLASHFETYGMVLAEALAHGVPVLVTDVGGVREALGSSGRGLPGLLVAAGSAAELGAALRRWLTDADLRGQLRAAAAERRRTLPDWSSTVQVVAAALAGAAPSAEHDNPGIRIR